MAAESGGDLRERKTENEDVEMADISLLNSPDDDSSQREGGAEPQSWYSAHGRGFSMNGRQTETQEAPSHIGTVLGEAYYSRERCVTPFEEPELPGADAECLLAWYYGTTSREALALCTECRSECPWCLQRYNDVVGGINASGSS